jgi:glycosyltransferase involved in cell wall biosynthesis
MNIELLDADVMSEISGLGQSYSTTRRLIKSDCEHMAESINQLKKGDDRFETSLFLQEGEGRQGDGGLRKQGYFKKSGDKKPLVTVVTVVYNGVAFLEGTILSVINQTYDNVEYIIVDGGSTDGTLDIIRKYEEAIDYWVSESDKGIYDAMNKGISLGSGEWVNFMNAGDFFFSLDTIKDIYTASNNNNDDVTVIYGDHEVSYPCKRKTVTAGEVKKLWRGSQFCHQSSFTRLDHHKKHRFNTFLKIAADFEFFYKTHKSDFIIQYHPQVLSTVSAGGVSDENRIESILEWWMIVDKKVIVNLLYLSRLMFEITKSFVKKSLRVFF